MRFTKTELNDVYIIELDKIGDERGYFGRVWCKNEFEEVGLNANFVQANKSYSKDIGTIRGLHFQVPPYSEVKLMSCVKGKIWDLVLDLRPDSKTYKKWIGIELSGSDNKMIYVPEGFAHGYQTLEGDSEVFYPTTNFYHPSSERGVRYNDPLFNIEWPIKEDLTISKKDLSWPNYIS
jgi:dTDP-4-dehydrorhamnose 3,5-epimerase